MMLLAGMMLAQAACGPVHDVAKHLKDEYNEELVGYGIDKNGTGITMMFASPGGQTYTMAAVTPQGVACLIATGSRWTAKPPKPEGEGA